MKRFLTILIIITMLLSVVGCEEGDKKKDDSVNAGGNPQNTAAGSVPTDDLTETEIPSFDINLTGAPTTETPTAETSATETPATEAPVTEVPATKVPATEAPATKAPATKAPATEAPKPVVSKEDAEKCIGLDWVNDTNAYETTEQYKFEYHFFIYEKLDAKYKIEKVVTKSATVNGGQACTIYQTSNKARARELSLANCAMFENLLYGIPEEEILKSENIKEFELGSCVVSPLLDKGVEYTDFYITLEISFTNGAVTTVTTHGSQSDGIGGYALDSISPEDYT